MGSYTLTSQDGRLVAVVKVSEDGCRASVKTNIKGVRVKSWRSETAYQDAHRFAEDLVGPFPSVEGWF